MFALGIEGTAHTAGVGIVDEACRVLALERAFYKPAQGGIHPREAANFMADHVVEVIERALAAARLTTAELEVICFSQGPGLGPCLRTVATAARALAVAAGKPLIGVNHCVAHIEIGMATTACRDPVTLYVSGGNTQVIAFAKGRYRVFGETLDIGLGNLLDKFGRENGMGFYAGPEIERRARETAETVDLPYSVRGMDVQFSGILTAAEALLAKGIPLPVVCRSLQETTFAMVTEVTERAMAHLGKSEVLLTGGVAQNERLREMVRSMAEERGGRSFVPAKEHCADNGVMIAWTGLQAYRAGVRSPIEDSRILQRFRTDQVEAVWRKESAEGGDAGGARGALAPDGVRLGAEAEVRVADLWGKENAVHKRRRLRSYRSPALDRALRLHRTKEEARLLVAARGAGVAVPLLQDVDLEESVIMLERVDGPESQSFLPTLETKERALVLRDVGKEVGRLHAAGIIHGDLTTSNILLRDRRPVLIDFGLGEFSREPADQGADLHVLEESLRSAHPEWRGETQSFLDGYLRTAGPGGPLAVGQLRKIAKQGRYT